MRLIIRIVILAAHLNLVRHKADLPGDRISSYVRVQLAAGRLNDKACGRRKDVSQFACHAIVFAGSVVGFDKDLIPAVASVDPVGAALCQVRFQRGYHRFMRLIIRIVILAAHLNLVWHKAGLPGDRIFPCIGLQLATGRLLHKLEPAVRQRDPVKRRNQQYKGQHEPQFFLHVMSPPPFRAVPVASERVCSGRSFFDL